jgi:heme/copper-type cytochrome/quinol oxidase subunit 2
MSWIVFIVFFVLVLLFTFCLMRCARENWKEGPDLKKGKRK